MVSLGEAQITDIAAVFVLPLIALSVMTGIESLVESLGWRLRMLKFGWDLTVLSVGIVAGVFALPAMANLPRSAAVVGGSVSVIWSIGVGVIIMHFRKGVTGRNSYIGFVLGLAAFTLPVYFILTAPRGAP